MWLAGREPQAHAALEVLLIGPATRRGVTDLAVELDVAKKGERAGPCVARGSRPCPGSRAHDAPQRGRAARTRGLRRVLLRRAQPHAVSVAVRHRDEVDTGGITRDARFYALLGADPRKSLSSA